MCTGFAWHAAISHNPVRTITPGPSRSTATHRYKPPLWVHQRERERWEKGLRNETSKSNREDEMGWSKDLKASTTDRGAVLRSETYTLVLSSPSSSSSILHLGPVGLCSHLLSLSRSLYSLEQQALNQARQKAHWDPTAGACLSWMCHNTGGLSWGVQPPPPPPPPPDMGENMKIDMTQRTDHVRLMWQSKAGRMCHVCACFLDNETIVIEWHVVHMGLQFRMIAAKM